MNTELFGLILIIAAITGMAITLQIGKSPNEVVWVAGRWTR